MKKDKEVLHRAFDNLLYIEIKSFFDYSQVGKFQEYLNKKIDIVLDQNQFPDITQNLKKVEAEFFKF